MKLCKGKKKLSFQAIFARPPSFSEVMNINRLICYSMNSFNSLIYKKPESKNDRFDYIIGDSIETLTESNSADY